MNIPGTAITKHGVIQHIISGFYQICIIQKRRDHTIIYQMFPLQVRWIMHESEVMQDHKQVLCIKN